MRSRLNRKEAMVECAEVMKEFYLSDLSMEVVINDSTVLKLNLKRDSKSIYAQEMELKKQELRDGQDIKKSLGR